MEPPHALQSYDAVAAGRGRHLRVVLLGTAPPSDQQAVTTIPPASPRIHTSKHRHPRVRRARRIAVGALISALVIGAVPAVSVAARPQPAKSPAHAASRLFGHKVQRDSMGRILAWHRPAQNGGYDHVLRVAWHFLEQKVPRDRRWGTGLPVYLVSSVYDGRSRQGSYWQHNPASLYAQFVDSVVAWHAYSGDGRAIDLVRRMLDHQLTHGTTPVSWAWGRVPFATGCGGDRDYGRCLAGMPRRFYGGIETDKVGELGAGYVQFYELTGERRFLRAAIASADGLARHVRRGDAEHTPWAFRVNAKTGAVLRGEKYGGMIVSPIRLFDELIRLGVGDVQRYIQARDIAWRWLLDYPLNPRSPAYRKWSGYFEDIPHNERNLNQASPTMTARYLLMHPNPEAIDPDWREQVQDVVEWVRSYLGRGPFFGAWGIDEQRGAGSALKCCSAVGLGSDTARWAAVNALYAARTGDDVARGRAVAALNYATYFTDEDGRVTCCGADFSNPYWFDDGYADYTRSFNWAMAALPDLAPRRQDHVLGSTSTVQHVRYMRHSVRYRVYDASGTEVLRLSFRPRTVSAEGRMLSPHPVLDAEGYTVSAAGGGDYVIRVRRDAARSVVVS